jgi:hypothetical protein
MISRRSVFAYLQEQKRGFIRAFHQPAAYSVGVQHPAQLHADHLLNSGFALRRGLRYVRMALVEGEINMDYGRKIEKKLTQSNAQDKSQYLFDYIVLMKALNTKPPSDPENYFRRREEIASRIVSECAEK